MIGYLHPQEMGRGVREKKEVCFLLPRKVGFVCLIDLKWVSFYTLYFNHQIIKPNKNS